MKIWKNEVNQFVWCHQNLDLGLKNLTMSDINYHLLLPGESVENFMTLVNHQILVTGCGDTSNEERRFTLKDLHLRTVRTVSVLPSLCCGVYVKSQILKRGYQIKNECLNRLKSSFHIYLPGVLYKIKYGFEDLISNVDLGPFSVKQPINV